MYRPLFKVLRLRSPSTKLHKYWQVSKLFFAVDRVTMTNNAEIHQDVYFTKENEMNNDRQLQVLQMTESFTRSARKSLHCLSIVMRH